MSMRLLWMINAALVVAALALIALGYSMTATAVALAAVIFSAYVSNVDRTRIRERFVATHKSVDHIKATEDLSRFRAIREKTGRVHAVREVRRAYPGMELAEAVQLVDEAL